MGNLVIPGEGAVKVYAKVFQAVDLLNNSIDNLDMKRGPQHSAISREYYAACLIYVNRKLSFYETIE